MSGDRPPSSATVLRIAVEADAPCLSALATQVFLATYATAGITPALAEEAHDRFARDVFAARLRRPDVRIVVAARGAPLVGYAELTLDADHALVDATPAAELDRLYVQSPFLRTGVGTRLLAAAEATARTAGMSALWLTAWVGNARARAFYASRGYRDVGSTTYAFGGDVFENRLFLRRLAADARRDAP